MVITLVGYRATGKTTVGTLLAEKLGWEFYDIDPEIERRGKKSIAAMFAEDGEPFFREIETAVLEDQLIRDRVVVSTGGGTVLKDRNRELMRDGGPVVWLQARVETIQSRMAGDPGTALNRPSLTGTDPLQEVPGVLATRTPYYEQVATIAVPVDSATPRQIVSEILSLLPPEVTA